METKERYSSYYEVFQYFFYLCKRKQEEVAHTILITVVN